MSGISPSSVLPADPHYRPPGGVNVYFDNVGGALLDKVLPNMAHYGRIAVCGLVAGYSEQQPGPARYDQILARRLQVTGFFSPDFIQRGAQCHRSCNSPQKWALKIP